MDNNLTPNAGGDHQALGKAIIARIKTKAHTAIEFYGPGACSNAILGIIKARQGLLCTNSDCSFTLASKKVGGRAAGARGRGQRASAGGILGWGGCVVLCCAVHAATCGTPGARCPRMRQSNRAVHGWVGALGARLWAGAWQGRQGTGQ